MFILEPSPVAQGLARKKVNVCEYPDGRLEIQHDGIALPYRMFDKMRRVNQAPVVDNKHLDAALALAHASPSRWTGSAAGSAFRGSGS